MGLRKFLIIKNFPMFLETILILKIFYNDLKKINFPLGIINKYTFYESKRWDLETKNQKIIKLPSKII